MPHVAILIVNYKGRDDTLQCLESLGGLTYPNFAIYLVDQNSGDGTPEAVRAQFSGVHVIESVVNDGFTGGNNRAIRAALAAGSDYVFLLNNDTTVEPGLLEPLIALAESDASIGIVGPKMLYHAEPDIIWSAGAQVDEIGHSRRLRDGETDDPAENDTPQDVGFIVGCGLLARRALLERIGLLDERYFLYFEESDWCARARRAGWRVVYQPAARLWHKVSRTTGADSPLTLYYMRRNQLLYLRKNGSLAGWVSAIVDALRLSLVWTIRGQRAKRRVLLRAVTDALRGRYGQTDAAALSFRN